MATAASLMEAELLPPPRPPLPALELEPEAEDMLFMYSNIVDDDSDPTAGASAVYEDEYENEFSSEDGTATVDGLIV